MKAFWIQSGSPWPPALDRHQRRRVWQLLAIWRFAEEQVRLLSYSRGAALALISSTNEYSATSANG
jgi:enterochelin esterase-like enzyme